MTGLPLWNILVCAVLYTAATLPVTRVGHQGLFYDRLNGDYASTPITTASKGLYHNRNRSYSPHLGRFVRSDPNATGVMLAADGARGSRLGAEAAAPDLQALLGSGFSLYQAYGSAPLMNTDARGLFFNLAGMALSLYTASDIEAIYNDQVIDTGITLAGFVSGVIDGYAGDQEAMLEWALDWSLPDDLWDRPFEEEDYGGSGGSGHYMAGSARAARTVATLTDESRRLLKEICNSYDEARALTAGHRGAIQAHHLVEARWFYKYRIFAGSSNDVPAIILSNKQHQLITNKRRKMLPYGQEATKDKIRDVYMEVYSDIPGAWEAIAH